MLTATNLPAKQLDTCRPLHWQPDARRIGARSPGGLRCGHGADLSFEKGERAMRIASIGAIPAFAILTLAAPLSAAEAKAPITFTKDVAPIMREKCEVCHRSGEAAPMSLTNYQEVRPWARSIKQKVESRTMPPWHI